MSRLDDINRRFDQQKILVMDGASGTLRCDHPHRLYIPAGADIVTTDTFCRHTAERCHPQSVYDYNFAKVRDILDDDTLPRHDFFIAGSIAPHYADPDKPDAQVLGLIQGGCDLLLLETIYDIPMAVSCLRSIQRTLQEAETPDLPIMVSATVNSRGTLPSGETVEQFAEAMQPFNPFSIGLNCSEGIDSMLAPMRRIATLTECHHSLCPSAGLPNQQGQYPDTDDHIITRLTPLLADRLIDIIGGCCGTTPTLTAAEAALARMTSTTKAKLRK